MAFPVQSREDRAAEEIRERIAKARQDAQEAQKALAEKADDPTPEGAEAFKELLRKRDEATACIDELQGEWEKAVGAGISGRAVRSFGRSSVLAPRVVKAVRDALGDGKALESPAGAVLAPSYLAPDVFALPATPATGLVWPLFRPQAVVDAGTVEYLRQTAPTDQGQAAPVDPLADKPQTIVSVELKAEPLSVIATVSESLDRMVLADTGSLETFVGDTLARAVLSAVDRECLNGSATPGPGFTGLMNAVGTSTVGPPGAGQNMADVIALGISAVRSSGFEPDGVVINPADYTSIVIAKASTSGEYMLGPQASTPSPNVWGIPAVPSPNLAAGFAIVGQFSAATLYVRETMVISWAEWGKGTGTTDLFVQNAVRARAEVRLLLAIHVPAAFCKVDLVA